MKPPFELVSPGARVVVQKDDHPAVASYPWGLYVKVLNETKVQHGCVWVASFNTRREANDVARAIRKACLAFTMRGRRGS